MLLRSKFRLTPVKIISSPRNSIEIDFKQAAATIITKYLPRGNDVN